MRYGADRTITDGEIALANKDTLISGDTVRASYNVHIDNISLEAGPLLRSGRPLCPIVHGGTVGSFLHFSRVMGSTGAFFNCIVHSDFKIDNGTFTQKAADIATGCVGSIFTMPIVSFTPGTATPNALASIEQGAANNILNIGTLLAGGYNSTNTAINVNQGFGNTINIGNLILPDDSTGAVVGINGNSSYYTTENNVIKINTAITGKPTSFLSGNVLSLTNNAIEGHFIGSPQGTSFVYSGESLNAIFSSGSLTVPSPTTGAKVRGTYPGGVIFSSVTAQKNNDIQYLDTIATYPQIFKIGNIYYNNDANGYLREGTTAAPVSTTSANLLNTASASILSSGQLYIGQTTGLPLPKTVTGDVTVTNAGVAAIKSSVALTGSPTAPTVAITTNNTQLATTAAVTTALAGYIPTSTGRIGQVSLTSGTGTATVSISGITSSSRAFITFVSIGGTITTTWQYSATCTAGMLTIKALNNTGGANTSDTSTLNYEVIN